MSVVTEEVVMWTLRCVGGFVLGYTAAWAVRRKSHRRCCDRYALRIHFGPRWTWHPRWRAGGCYVDKTLEAGSQATAQGVIINQRTGDTAGTPDAPIAWLSSDESVFTVAGVDLDHGLVTAVAEGVASLTASCSFNGVPITSVEPSTVTVTAVAESVFAIRIDFP